MGGRSCNMRSLASGNARPFRAGGHPHSPPLSWPSVAALGDIAGNPQGWDRFGGVTFGQLDWSQMCQSGPGWDSSQTSQVTAIL